MIKLGKLNEKQQKELYFEGLFTQQVKKYATETDGKFVDVVIVCTNKSLEIFFNKLYSKYKVKHSYNDFMNECIYWSYFSIQRFQIRDEGTWEGMIDGTDKPNIGRLISNIKTTVENEIIRFMNEKVLYTTKRTDGVKEHDRLVVNTTSLDTVLANSEGGTETLLNMISSEMNFWSVKDGYKLNHFLEWFNEHKERILTKSQVQYLNNMAKAQHLGDGYTENDVAEVTGVSDTNRSTYTKRIKERVLKAWEKENPMGQKTQLQMMKEKEIELYTPLIDLIYVEETAGQNKAISDWFIANLDNEKVNNLVYDNTAKEESIAVTHAYVNKGDQIVIPSKVLYKLVALVEKRLDYLQVMDTTSTPIQSNPVNKKKNIERANKRKEFIEQPCYVYDKEGNLLRIEAWKPFNEKVNGVNEVLPTGITNDCTNID